MAAVFGVAEHGADAMTDGFLDLVAVGGFEEGALPDGFAGPEDRTLVGGQVLVDEDPVRETAIARERGGGAEGLFALDVVGQAERFAPVAGVFVPGEAFLLESRMGEVEIGGFGGGEGAIAAIGPVGVVGCGVHCG